MSGSFWTEPGGQRVYLGTLARESALNWGSTYSGGDGPASVTLDMDPAIPHAAFTPGIRCGITVGVRDTWKGTVNSPTVTDRRVVSGTGDGTLPRWFASAAAGGAYAIASAFDLAVGRGLLLTRTPTLPTITETAVTASMNLGEALDHVAGAVGQFWQVTDGNLAFYTGSNGEAYQLVTADTGAGRTLDGYVSRLIVLYINIATGNFASVQLLVPNAIVAKEGVLDLTGSTTQLSTAQATTQGQAALDRIGKQANYTGQLTFLKGQVLNVGGSPVDLTTVRAGFLATPRLAAANSLGGVGSQPSSFIAGEVRYDADTESLTVTPVDAQARSANDLLAQIRS